MKRFLLTLTIIFSAHLIGAQPSLSLSQAIEIGLANSYQLQIAKQNLEIANNNDNWLAAGRGPRIDASLNWQNSYFNSRAAGFLREQALLTTGITPAIDGTWVVYDGNRAKITKQQLEQIVNQETMDVDVAVENTVQNIILAYYQVLIQEEQLSTLQEVLDLSRDRIGLQEVRKEFGQSGTFDILQTTDAYLNDSTSVVLQQNNVATAYRNLNLAMGEDQITRTYQLTDNLDFQPTVLQLSELENALFANNTNLKNLTLIRDLAHLNTQLQDVARRPTITIGSGLSYALSGSDGDGLINSGEVPAPIDLGGSTRNFNYYLGATAAYTIYDGGTRKRNRENAEVEELVAQMNIADLKRDLSNQLHNALANYNNQIEVLRLTENLINNAEKNLQIGKERFDGGLISSFDYRSIQLAFVNASQSRLNAIFNLKNTETELMRLTGQLVEEN